MQEEPHEAVLSFLVCSQGHSCCGSDRAGPGLSGEYVGQCSGQRRAPPSLLPEQSRGIVLEELLRGFYMAAEITSMEVFSYLTWPRTDSPEAELDMCPVNLPGLNWHVPHLRLELRCKRVRTWFLSA